MRKVLKEKNKETTMRTNTPHEGRNKERLHMGEVHLIRAFTNE